MIQLWIGYKLPDNPDLMLDAGSLEANAISQRNIELQACANGNNPYQCEQQAEIAFRLRMLAIPEVRFSMYYSFENEVSGKNAPAWLLDLKPDEVTNPSLDQMFSHLQPGLVFPIGIYVDHHSFRRIRDNQQITYQQNFINNVCNLLQEKTPRMAGRRELPIWMIVLLVIFAASAVGVGLSLFSGTFIPFWISFGFSVIFSIEKWFGNATKSNIWLGRLYRLTLNLSILSLLGLVIRSGIKLFTHNIVQSELIGSILFVAQFAFFIWLWRVVAKNSWRWPSMKLTIITLIGLSIVFAFAGVQPLTGYKDIVLNMIKSVLAFFK